MNIILIIIVFIRYLVQILSLIVIIDIVLSYFMPPFNPIRNFLDRIVNPLLAPIRRVVPPIGMIDFSPLILLILIQVVGSILISLLGNLYHG
jgi:YggT family protein